MWELTPDGYLVNQKNGKCADVWGNNAIHDGSLMLIWDCFYSEKMSDQRWEYEKDTGLIKSLLETTKCVDVQDLTWTNRVWWNIFKTWPYHAKVGVWPCT